MPPQVRVGRWSSLFFVTYMLFCATMMLDVLVGVVIEGFRVSNKGPQQTPAARGLGSEGGNMGDGGLNVGNSVVDDDEASMSGEASRTVQESADRGVSSFSVGKAA